MHTLNTAFCAHQVFDKDTDTNKEATFKLARDTKNPTAFEKERHLGTYRTTQSMAFAPPSEVCDYVLVSSHVHRNLMLLCPHKQPMQVCFAHSTQHASWCICS